ncbi:MAG: phospho-N-acetylmuramoyl-pentapeptide-transferase [Planctomycetes bacterium]|nr:phospho-N-acetylmuramoyl-pentapeptide-transferase [Planctomycetota bacterium]
MFGLFQPGPLESSLLRAALAAATSLGVTCVAIPRLAAWARRKDFGDREGKTHSDTLNELHSHKKRTPIVGGIAILAATLLASLAFADLRWGSVWLLLVGMLGLGALGLADDIAKTFGTKKTVGLTARQKLAVQVVFGAGAGAFLLGQAWVGGGAQALAAQSSLAIPFVGGTLAIGAVLYLLFATFVVTGTSNAVNLTDGLDGLAGGCALVAFGVYTGIALCAGSPETAAQVGITPVPGAAEVGVVLAGLAGGLTGFLVFNRPPAKVFMGDTGSLPLGGVLALAALVTKQELLLALVGGVFVAEALSVIAQVISFKLTGKRIFRCAPLHHHFEFGGWGESQVVTRFHAVALCLALISLVGVGGL